jgi:hypothetical protein
VIHADSHTDGTGGSLELQLITDNLQNPERIDIKVQNDATQISSGTDTADNYYWTGGQGFFTFTWGGQTNDGLVLSPFPLGNGFSIRLSIRSSTGISAAKIASWDSQNGVMSYIPWNLGEEIILFVYDCTNTNTLPKKIHFLFPLLIPHFFLPFFFFLFRQQVLLAVWQLC